MQGMIRLWPSLKVNLAVAWDDESKWVERISGLKPARDQNHLQSFTVAQAPRTVGLSEDGGSGAGVESAKRVSCGFQPRLHTGITGGT